MDVGRDYYDDYQDQSATIRSLESQIERLEKQLDAKDLELEKLRRQVSDQGWSIDNLTRD
jgi:peptidoglycan hydrolase CwlO-like protein